MTPSPRQQSPLVERAPELDTLARLLQALRYAPPGQGGGVVLVQAEAGGGKTSLLRAAAATAGVDIWWCACEPQLAPAPLQALRGLVSQLPLELLCQPASGEAFAGWLRLLRERPRPLLWLVDDLQWADSASIELLRYLARRIEGVRVLLVLALRSEPVTSAHPLLSLLGTLPPARTTRLQLAPLSVQGVAQLAASAGHDVQLAASVHATTGGNPFYAVEALAVAGAGVPLAVRSHVLAQAQRLSATARELLDRVAVAAGGLEAEVLVDGQEDTVEAVDEALAAGLLVQRGERLHLRHELARQALVNALAPARASALHEWMFHVLRQRGEPAARCVPHAVQAGLAGAVLELAPQACQAAARAGARREAADLIDTVLPFIALAPPVDRAALWGAHAQAHADAGHVGRALASRLLALALRRAADDAAATGIELREAARLHWLNGDQAAALAHGAEAVQLLQAHGTPHELAWAQATMAQLQMFDAQARQAEHWGRLALAHFDAAGDAPGQVHALNSVGFAQVLRDDAPASWALLQRAAALAREHALHEPLARTHTNLASLALVHRRLPLWQQACADGLHHAQAHDLDFYVACLRLRQAWGEVLAGHWAQARAGLESVQTMPGLTPIEEDQARMLLALLSLREGRPDGRAFWREALQGGHAPPVDPWYAPRAPALAEAAWLTGDDAALRAVVDAAWPAVLARGEAWRIGALAAWRRRAGGAPQPVDRPLPEPWALELAGDAVAAAAAWAERGCIYDSALAEAHGGDVHDALQRLETLGAAGAVRALRRRLRAQGAPALPRGRNRQTRHDLLGLTPRERAVLVALAEGLSNRAIAQRLHRSERTVEHHVAALLAKLGAGTRAEAVDRARSL